MSLSLNQFKRYLELSEPLLYNGIKRYLVQENKAGLKLINKLISKQYRFKELNKCMMNLFSKEIRQELLNIHNNGKMYSYDGYYSNIMVGDKNYKLPVNFDFNNTMPVEMELSCICPYEDAFALVYYDEFGIIQITPGFSLQKRNIKTDNGNDWIRHYIGRNDRGYIYKLRCERNGILFHKIGITKNIKQRMKQISNHINIIDYEYFEDYMIINAIRERAFHEENITKKLHLNEKFDGCNECYVLNIKIPNLNKSLDILENKYTMDRKLLELILKEMKCNEQ